MKDGEPVHGVSLREATKVWGYVGMNSFGGPAGQISVMHREIVEERHWVSESRFLHALNYCMVLPGPEAQQLATYIGWLMHGVRGGVIAGTFFIIPGFIAMLALSIIYATLGSVTWISGIFTGLQAAVVVLVIHAFIRISKRALTTPLLKFIAVASFLAIFLFNAPFPLLVVSAGIVGWLISRSTIGSTAAKPSHGPTPLLADDAVPSPRAVRSAFRAAVICAVLWVLPIIALVLITGTESVFTQEAFLFSKAALVTFGGAYAVLGYVAQQAVGRYGWVSSSEMATGLGLAESTPGPLIMVVQFIGFLAAYHNPGQLPPIVAGVIGSLITVWVTFVPCFLFIFLGAPFAERLRGNASLAGALAAISAAVSGVILDLAAWFALHTFFANVTDRSWGPITIAFPDPTSIQLPALIIAAIAALLLFKFKLSTLRLLGICSALGFIAAVLGLTST